MKPKIDHEAIRALADAQAMLTNLRREISLIKRIIRKAQQDRV